MLASVSTASARPTTIPALREWVPAAGAFQLGPSSRVLRPADAGALMSDAELFASELRSFAQDDVPVVVTSDPALDGDVLLHLGASDTALGEEGYEMVVGASLSINARTVDGAFYGTRTILQLLRQNESIPAGNARDWPRYGERGLMFPNGVSQIADIDFDADSAEGGGLQLGGPSEIVIVPTGALVFVGFSCQLVGCTDEIDYTFTPGGAGHGRDRSE